MTNVSLQPVLLTSRDAAAMLGLCERALYNLARRGLIERVRVGTRGVRFRLSDLERFSDRLAAA